MTIDIVEAVARHPAMSKPDGRWRVLVVTVRGRQSFRVYDQHQLPAPGSSGMPSPGRVCVTIAEVRDLLGSDFDRLVEERGKRFDGGR